MVDYPGAPAPAPQQALCAIHASTPATGTCRRCGTYVCEVCTGGTDLCTACRGRLGIDQFPFSRDAWDVGGLVTHAWNAFKTNPGAAIGVMLAMFIVPFVIAIFLQGVPLLFKGSGLQVVILFAAQIVQMALSVILALGANSVFLELIRGRPLTFDSYTRGMRRSGAGLAQYLAVILVAVVFGAVAVAVVAASRTLGFWILPVLGLLGFVIGAYVLLGIVFMQFELVLDSACGPLEAISRSWSLVSGRRWSVFGAGFVAGVVMLAGVMACGVGALVSYPVGMLVFASLFLALRTGSGLPEPTEG